MGAFSNSDLGLLNPEAMITARISLDEVVDKGFKALLEHRDEHCKILVNAQTWINNISSWPMKQTYSVRMLSDPASSAEKRCTCPTMDTSPEGPRHLRRPQLIQLSSFVTALQFCVGKIQVTVGLVCQHRVSRPFVWGKSAHRRDIHPFLRYSSIVVRQLNELQSNGVFLSLREKVEEADKDKYEAQTFLNVVTDLKIY